MPLKTAILLSLICLGAAGLKFPELNYKGKAELIRPDSLYERFRREGNTLPEWVIRRHAIYDPKSWASLKKKLDRRTGYRYFQEKLKVKGYGDIYLIALTIDAPLKAGLQAALDYSRDNFGYGREEIELKVKEEGRETILREKAGTILPGSLYKSYDPNGNEIYGYRILLKMDLPRPVSDKRFILRVLNRFLPLKPRPLIVSEWYQAQGEGEFKYLMGCDTFYPIDKGSHLLTIKFNGDVGGMAGGIKRLLSLDFIAESYLRRMAFGIKSRAESP
ncbi:TPA: hypothetical protein EYP37_10765 [Candidatus Poribacteria bacterium]|nr:hypothetical protein [Candidatus Poribacteria bacterium]